MSISKKKKKLRKSIVFEKYCIRFLNFSLNTTELTSIFIITIFFILKKKQHV